MGQVEGAPKDKAGKKLRKAATIAVAMPRAMVAANCIFLKGLWCGKRAGGYLVFGPDQGFQPLRALGPQLNVFHDTNQLLESFLFRRRGRRTSSFDGAGAPPSTSTASTSGDAGDDHATPFTQVGLPGIAPVWVCPRWAT
jgi:hypothetical protein